MIWTDRTEAPEDCVLCGNSIAPGLLARSDEHGDPRSAICFLCMHEVVNEAGERASKFLKILVELARSRGEPAGP